MEVIFWNGGIPWIMSRTIGPYKVAYWLRKHDHSAQVIDFIDRMSEETLYTVTKKFITSETLVLALSTTFLGLQSHVHSDGNKFWLMEKITNVVRRIRAEHPNIKFVLGGYRSEKLPSMGLFDATIMTYSTATEEIFLEYIRHLKTGSRMPLHLSCKVNGESRPYYNMASTQVYNIEVDDFKWSLQDAILPEEPLPLDVSRGCIFACRFCQYQHTGKKKLDYIRGMEYIKEELIHNYHMFGTTSYYVLDDTFNDTEIKLKEFHSIVKALPFKISFSAFLRADLIHRFPDMAYYLKDAGLFGSYFGIESLHPSASKVVGKGWSGKYAKTYIPELYHNIWNKEVAVHTNFIVGLPTEPIESVYATADWFIDNKLHSITFDGLILTGPEDGPGRSIKSEFDKNAEKYGFKFGDLTENSLFPQWTNDYWDRDSAAHHAQELNNKIDGHRKIHPWALPGVVWQGYTKQEALGKYRKENLDLNARQARKLELYIEKLLSL